VNFIKNAIGAGSEKQQQQQQIKPSNIQNKPLWISDSIRLTNRKIKHQNYSFNML